METWKKIKTLESKSSDAIHIVEQSSLGNLRCTCQSFRIQKKGFCKHTESVSNELKKKADKKILYVLVKDSYNYNDEGYDKQDGGEPVAASYDELKIYKKKDKLTKSYDEDDYHSEPETFHIVELEIE